jgi:hypothetical protein
MTSSAPAAGPSVVRRHSNYFCIQVKMQHRIFVKMTMPAAFHVPLLFNELGLNKRLPGGEISLAIKIQF